MNTGKSLQPVRTVHTQAEIVTGHLTHTSQKHYSLKQLASCMLVIRSLDLVLSYMQSIPVSIC